MSNASSRFVLRCNSLRVNLLAGFEVVRDGLEDIDVGIWRSLLDDRGVYLLAGF
jgi:hypothetical protein